MRVLDRRRFRADPDALLDDLAPGDAEIVLLQIGAPQSRRLLHPPARRAAAVLGRAHHDLPGVVPLDGNAFTISGHHPPLLPPPVHAGQVSARPGRTYALVGPGISSCEPPAADRGGPRRVARTSTGAAL